MIFSIYDNNQILYKNNNINLMVYGNLERSNNYLMKLRMTKEALIGFATYLLRIYNDKINNVHFHVDPLGNGIENQILGFFLTPSSPMFVLKLKEKIDGGKCNGSYIQNKVNYEIKYDINTHPKDDLTEIFEIGHCNIADIKIFNMEMKDITDKSINVTIEIGRQGLVNFALNLFRIADNFKLHSYYTVSNNNDEYSLGIRLNEGNCSLMIICDYLGNIFDYKLSD